MTNEMLVEKMELKELVDTFSNLADAKDAKSQGELFLPDGKLEFQIGFDGEIQNIVGREALVAAFSSTIEPCKAVYHINGQHNVTLNEDMTEAEGTAYCQAILVNEEDAIVGAASVVTHDVTDYEVVVGSPAKVIRTLDQERCEKKTQP